MVGTGTSGWYTLRALCEAGRKPVVVYTLSERLAHTKSTYVSYDRLAAERELDLRKIDHINDPRVLEDVRALDLDLIIVISWSQLLSTEVLSVPRYGCLGTHLSPLPKGRGRAPLNWAIIKGERRWANTLQLLAPGADEGPIVAQRWFSIAARDTAETAYLKATELGVDMVLDAVNSAERGELVGTPQADGDASVFPRRRPDDGVIDWTRSAEEVFNWIRALGKPYPGAFTQFGGRRLYIWTASLWDAAGGGVPGEVRWVLPGRGVVVQCGDGTVLIERIEHQDGVEGWADEPSRIFGTTRTKLALAIGDRLGE